MDLNIPLLKTVYDINDLETATSFKSKLSMSYEWTPLCGGVWDCVFDVCVRAYLVFGVFCVFGARMYKCVFGLCVCLVCFVCVCVCACFVCTCACFVCLVCARVRVCVWTYVCSKYTSNG